jgi:hypothetical protein
MVDVGARNSSRLKAACAIFECIANIDTCEMKLQNYLQGGPIGSKNAMSGGSADCSLDIGYIHWARYPHRGIIRYIV